MNPTARGEAWHAYCKGMQDAICQALARADGSAAFEQTEWQRPAGGGGRMRLLRGARVEKAGVNVSAVHGETNPITGNPFFASGLSLIVHPYNPHAPTVHLNVRYFEEDGGRYWYGGGMDLTPMGFPYEADTRHFHDACKRACEAGGANHEKLRKWADEYFFVKHRNRARGVGGIFFDEHASGDAQRDEVLPRAVAENFLDAYLPILERRMDQAFTPEEKETQLRARGVYVEFNLLYDRGTRFGFESGGNPDAILASLPPNVKW